MLKTEKSKLRNWIEELVEAFIVVLIIRTFIIQTSMIPTGSMMNTILPHDFILINKFKYRFTQPKRGDIVVFKYPEEPEKDFIKRAIGLSNDKLEIHNKQVLINDELIDEPYKIHIDNNIYPIESGIPRDYLGPIIIPESNLFVMGDNRDNSKDSRYWGFLDMKLLKGKPIIRIWPIWRIGLVK